MHYKDLPPEQKLEVVQRWVEYCSNFKIGMVLSKHGQYPTGILNIEKYFQSFCGDFHEGTKKHALRFATRCYYCECELTRNQDLTTEKDPLPTEITIDHFYSKKHKMRNVNNVLVVSCYRCNQIKGSVAPENLLVRLEKGKSNVPGGWDEATEARLRKILFDVILGKSQQVYYLK